MRPSGAEWGGGQPFSNTEARCGRLRDRSNRVRLRVRWAALLQRCPASRITCVRASAMAWYDEWLLQSVADPLRVTLFIPSGGTRGRTSSASTFGGRCRLAVEARGVSAVNREGGRVGEFVRVEVAEGVATIRLDRPKMNALNAQVQDEIAEAAARVSDDPDVRAVILYGGERVFAAGADIKEMADMSYAQMAERSARLQASFSAVASIPKPTVAAVTGYALGGGLELALTADFRVLGQGAKVGQPEILLGIIPGAGGTQRLPRLIGPARAKDLIFTGRQVKADEALAIGLADKVVPDAEVYQAATELVRRYAGGPALALRAAKQAVNGGLEVDLATGLEIERLQFSALFATEDQKSGMRSFMESGPGKATFEGR
jgi:enoyl-CoA hydratase/carnithine racemase